MDETKDVVGLATQILNTKHQEIGSGYTKMLRVWSPIEKRLARSIIATDIMISDLGDALKAYPDSNLISLAQSIILRNEYLESIVSSLCQRCGRLMKNGNYQSCFYCVGNLCLDCFEEYGHCGHEEADKLNEKARKVSVKAIQGDIDFQHANRHE